VWQIGGHYQGGIINSKLYNADALLFSEANGFAIDATVSGGKVSVKDTTTAANRRSNAPLNSSNLAQAGTSGKNVLSNNGLIVNVASGQVAQDWDGQKFGILIEPAATNLIPDSQDFDGPTWGDFASTETNDAATAPDGTTTAASVVADAGSNFHQIFTNSPPTVVAGTTYTYSVFLQDHGTPANKARWANVFVNSDTDNDWFGAIVDLATGAVTQSGNGSLSTLSAVSVRFIGFGWYRVAITGIFGTGVTMYAAVGFVDSATPSVLAVNGTYSFTATGSETFYVYGTQLESGAIATSYIPTAGSTATRAIDDVTVATSTLPYSATLGTIYFDGMTAMGAGDQVAWQLDDTTANERLLFWRQSDNDPQFSIVDGGVDQDQVDAGTLASNQRVQFSAAWAVNDVDVSLNGGAAQAGDGTNTLPTVTQLQLGCDQGTAAWNSLIYRLVYVPRQVQTSGSNLPTWRYNYPAS
jgi:hypothetical protein